MAQVANATDGKSADGLVDALVAAAQKHIAADVSSGRLTQAQADQILSGLKQHITAPRQLDRTARRATRSRRPARRARRSGEHTSGSPRATSGPQLQSGKTLGEIADATAGKSKAGLIAALVADEKSHLNQAVKDGRLTQAQADAMAANIESRVTDARRTARSRRIRTARRPVTADRRRTAPPPA